MTTNEMHQAAVKNMEQSGESYGVSKFTLSNGDLVVCYVHRVAGRSVVAKHYRTNYGLKPAAAEYAKAISKTKVIELLRG